MTPPFAGPPREGGRLREMLPVVLVGGFRCSRYPPTRQERMSFAALDRVLDDVGRDLDPQQVSYSYGRKMVDEFGAPGLVPLHLGGQVGDRRRYLA